MNDTSLPEGWLETTLGNICIINPKNKLDDDDTVGFLPMTAVPQTYGDKPDYQTRTWSDAKKGYTHFQENDVLFAKVTPCFENGKSMIAENCPAGVGSGSSELIVLRTDPSCVLPMLVLNLIRSYEFKQLGAQSMTGAVGLRRVPKSFVEQYPFPLPPIAEQREIARRLDELLAQVDTLKTRLDAIPAILKRFRQSTLAAATSGKLTEEWRAEHQDVELDLNDIEEHRQKEFYGNDYYKGQWKKKKPSNLGKIETEFEPWASLPGNWEWVAIYTVATIDKFSIVDGPFGSDLKSKDYVDNGEIPVLTISLMYDLSDLSSAKTISRDKFDTIKRSQIRGGDILLAKIGSTYGLSCLYPETHPVAMIPANMCKVTVDQMFFNREYVRYWLKSSVFKFYLDKIVSFSAQPAYNVGNFKKLPIPLPPLEEQTEIVRRVEELFAFADQVEQRVNDALARVNHLTQSILAKAFRGELTESWRANNPDLITGENSAEALLQRIKSERAKLNPKKKTRKNGG